MLVTAMNLPLQLKRIIQFGTIEAVTIHGSSWVL